MPPKFPLRGHLPRALSLGALFLLCGPLSGTAHAADATAERLDRIEAQVVSAETALSRVKADVTDRAGFLGAEEARRRFEDGVYHYLVGDYDKAAKTFFTLVESGALAPDDVLLSDSEFYLGECLFELGNYALAEEAFQDIIDAGPSHAFFRDGVRRQLELYGLTGQGKKFYALYDKYIVTGRVEPTDLVKYTVGKSFYRQREMVRAKSMLGEIPESSMYYGRAHYLLGTILVVDGSYDDAMDEFERASGISVDTPEDREVVDLANLALGRLAYETGDLDMSAEYYQRIDRNSRYWADALYEAGWTFIKKGDYQQALQSVEIFLLAFPEHRYTAQLKLLQGHLNMKEAAYESALANYEGVVEEYTPVHDAIRAIEQDAMKPMEWFGTIVELESLDRYYGSDIPGYAVEMLAADPEVARAVEVARDLNHQKAEIEASEQLIVELKTAFAGGDDAISSFQEGRRELDRLDLEVLRLKGDLLQVEEAWLLASLPENLHAQVRALRGEREQLINGDGSRAREDASALAKEYQGKADRIQQDAAKVAIQVEELSAQSKQLREKLGSADLDESARADVGARLSEVDGDLDHARSELNDLTRQRDELEARARDQRDAAADAGSAAMKAGYDKLHADLAALRRHVTSSDRTVVTSRIDGIWRRLDSVDTGGDSIASRMGGLEKTELSTLRRRLDEETRNVADQRREYTSRSASADTLADQVTRDGFTTLGDEFATSVLKADKGIVDVYWVRKVSVSDERKALGKEQEVLLRELDGRFRLIRQGLPEPTKNLPPAEQSDEG